MNYSDFRVVGSYKGRYTIDFELKEDLYYIYATFENGEKIFQRCYLPAAYPAIKKDLERNPGKVITVDKFEPKETNRLENIDKNG